MDKVRIDGSVLSKQIASGISSYLINIYSYFKKLEQAYGIQTSATVLNALPEHNMLYRDSSLREGDFETVSTIRFIFSLVFRADPKYRIYHSPYMHLPRRTTRHINLLTVHDLINFKTATGWRGRIRKYLLDITLARADYFICISQTTRAELLRYRPGIPADRIFVVSQGIDPLFLENDLVPPPAAIAGKPYLLYVGQRGGYKNFASLITLFSRPGIRERFNLVCVGGGRFTAAEQQRLTQQGLGDTVVHTGYLTNHQLRGVYQHARALLYASQEEGFGLPILEAMACLCPVVTGNFSSMKEVGSTHAILVDDYSADSLQQGIDLALGLSAAQKQNAKHYAQNFTWEETAKKTLAVYKAILAS